jgi:hypothetical protein
MNIYKAVVNGEEAYIKASSEEKARIKLYHIYKKKYGKIWITDLKLIKKIIPKAKPSQIKLKLK